MPGELKLKNGETKYLYKKAVAPLIGDRLAYRKKQMFTVPVGEWFRTTKAEYCRQSLPAGFFDTPEISNLCENHIAGQSNQTRELRALIAVRHWIDNC